MPTASGQTVLGRREAEPAAAPAFHAAARADIRIGRGQTQRLPVAVDGGPLIASLPRSAGVSLVLLRPDGTEEPSVRRIGVGSREALVVETPVAGVWTAEVRASDAAPLSTSGTLRLVVVDGPGPGLPPLAAARVDVVGTRVFADASASRVAAGDDVAYSWDWGDGTAPDAGRKVAHRYEGATIRRVTLTVTDGRGRSDTTRVVAVVGQDQMEAPAVTTSPLRRGTKVIWVRTRCPVHAAFTCHAVADVRVVGRPGAMTGARGVNPGKYLLVPVTLDASTRAGLASGAVERLALRVVVGDDSARAPLVLGPQLLRVQAPH
jgi:hypothetical protein